MKRTRLIAALGLVSLLATASSSALAHKLDPCLRVLVNQNGVLSQDRMRDRNLCPFAPADMNAAVHEHMTNFAVSMYRGIDAFPERTVQQGVSRFSYVTERRWTKERVRHKMENIVYGTWWNDDLMMYMLGEGWDFTKGLRNVQRVFAEDVKPFYPGGVAKCDVPAADHLARSSHFGALQHLHFMTTLPANTTSAQERIADTRERALSWIAFAYSVATGDVPPETPLSDADEQRLSIPSLAKNLCLKNASTRKVRTLFTRAGPSSAAKLKARNERTADVALGSILHVLQDSFSPAHTCRVERKMDRVDTAVLRDVFNYNEQNHDLHAARDGYPKWLQAYARAESSMPRYANDPIVVGAWLMEAVDKNLPWAEVRTHLLDTIFADDGASEASSTCIESNKD